MASSVWLFGNVWVKRVDHARAQKKGTCDLAYEQGHIGGDREEVVFSSRIGNSWIRIGERKVLFSKRLMMRGNGVVIWSNEGNVENGLI